MSSEFAKKLSRSQSDFLRVVWPEIKQICGGGSLIPVESVTQSGFAHKLDVLAGIDAWQQIEDGLCGGALRGIATRVQQSKTAWNTFTVRRSIPSGRPTEFHKRLAAARGRGYLLPFLTVQAYVDMGSLLSAGVARTQDVMAAIDEELWRTNPEDGSTFFYVNFDCVPNVRVLDYRAAAA